MRRSFYKRSGRKPHGEDEAAKAVRTCNSDRLRNKNKIDAKLKAGELETRVANGDISDACLRD